MLFMVNHDALNTMMNHDATRDMGWLPQLVWQLGSLLEPILLDVDMVTLSTTSWFNNSTLVSERLTKDERGPLLAAYGKKNCE